MVEPVHEASDDDEIGPSQIRLYYRVPPGQADVNPPGNQRSHGGGRPPHDLDGGPEAFPGKVALIPGNPGHGVHIRRDGDPDGDGPGRAVSGQSRPPEEAYHPHEES
jgi:hypothetical protein